MKVLSRADLGTLIHKEASTTALVSGLVLVIAASLWSLSSVGLSFLSHQVIGAWCVIQIASFLSLQVGRFKPALVATSWLALQFYFYSLLQNFAPASIPLDSTFFICSSVVLASFSLVHLRFVFAAWILTWASAFYWLHSGVENHAAASSPLMFAAGAHFLTFGIFAALQFYFFATLNKHVRMLGGVQTFDDQRLQAAKLQSMGDLTSSLIQEINDPISKISGHLNQVDGVMKELSGTNKELLKVSSDKIKQNIAKAADLTRAVGAYVYDSSLRNEELSVRALIEDSLLLIEANIKAQGIQFERDFENQDYAIHGNKVELSQLLINILSNARDACRVSDRKKISIGFGQEKGNLVVWIEDTGPGLPEENRSEAFKAYFTTKEHLQGTGLGLYISKMIADRHDAKLDFSLVKMDSGKVLGTRFFLTFAQATAKNFSSTFDFKKAA